ncbi:hypothetical protein ACFQ1B_23090 [Streptomyces mexicanus]
MSEADHDSFEERFAQALRDVGAGLDTGRRDLAAAGEARGRRLRTRRRAAVAGGVAGVALAGLAGTFVLPEGHDDAVHHRSAASTASTAPRPAPSPSPPPNSPAPWKNSCPRAGRPRPRHAAPTTTPTRPPCTTTAGARPRSASR